MLKLITVTLALGAVVMVVMAPQTPVQAGFCTKAPKHYIPCIPIAQGPQLPKFNGRY